MEDGKRETGNGKGEDGRGKMKVKTIARGEEWRMGTGNRKVERRNEKVKRKTGMGMEKGKGKWEGGSSKRKEKGGRGK